MYDRMRAFLEFIYELYSRKSPEIDAWLKSGVDGVGRSLAVLAVKRSGVKVFPHGRLHYNDG
jgi:hypothetical protein